MNYEDKLGLLKNAIKELETETETMRQKKFLIMGVALGLFYGIIGNMLASHYYEVFKGIIMWQFDKLFYANLTVLVIILIVVILVSWKWFLSMKKLEDALKAFEKIKKYSLVFT